MAVKIFTNQDNWNSLVGDPDNATSDYGAKSTDLAGGIVKYDSGGIASIGNGWATWSGGYTGDVIESGYGNTSLTLNISGMFAFGVQIEPNMFQSENFTITLSDGKTKTVEDNVEGDAGAQFFGFFGPGITSVTITDDSNDDFAVGNIFYDPQNGIDVSHDLPTVVANASSVAKKYGFVGAYLNHSRQHSISAGSAAKLEDAGLQIVSIFEAGGMDHAAYYEGAGNDSAFMKGVRDGEKAYTEALNATQGDTPGSAIYFGTEAPTANYTKKLLSKIELYYKGIEKGFSNIAKGPSEFAIGVYGYGATDNLIKDTLGIAQYSWISSAASSSVEGYSNWSLNQTKVDQSTPFGTVDIDSNYGAYFGQWT